MNYILVADKQEADNVKIPAGFEKETEIIVLGIGGPAALRTLSPLLLNGKFSKNDRFFNIGYVGSNEFPIGAVVSVGESHREFPSVRFPEGTYILDQKSKVKCYTSIDFVEETEHTGVFDMELFTLASLFPNIKSIKIVSDNLNFKDWKQVDIKDAWLDANEMLIGMLNTGV